MAPILADAALPPFYDSPQWVAAVVSGTGGRELGSDVKSMGQRGNAMCMAAAILACASLPATACWEEAATRYHLNPDLLQAIARTESGMNPQAIGINRDGSRDIGLMQVNSAWLPALRAYGIAERDLFEPCTNIHVGAWILAGRVSRLGYTWNAVGAYNAASPVLRRAYIARVRRQLAGTHRAAERPSPAPLTIRVSATAEPSS